MASTPEAVWRVVIADDDEDWRSLTSASFRRAGFQTFEARDGYELFNRYVALWLNGCPDENIVVVSDIAMPNCDGVSATRWVRSVSNKASVVLVTGESSPNVHRAAHEAGATVVLSKPIPCASLVAAVVALCR